MKQSKSLISLLLGLSLCLLGFLRVEAQKSTPQERVVHGVVLDAESKDPIPGVLITNTNEDSIKTLSNLNGYFSIKAKKQDKLKIEAIDYQSRFIKATKNNLRIRLKPKYSDEIIVIGQVKQKRSKYTGSRSHSKHSTVLAESITYVDEAKPSLAPISRNEYKGFKDNGFLSTAHKPLSTFSTDVDVASYGIMRENLNKGNLPPIESVRPEEWLNYFDYNYPKPEGKETIKINTELSACPWNEKHQIARIALRAKEIPSQDLAPSNLVFLIDVSGSMEGPTRLELVKASLRLLTSNLRANDKISIVVYAGSSGIVLPPTSGANKKVIIDALERLEAGGSTAGGAGIRLAYKVAREHFIQGGNNRIILCTDGDFNVGVSSLSELEKLISQERQSGVFLTILGYGMGNYKDNRLQTLSEAGNGNYAYIDNLSEARRFLIKEFGSSMYAVAKDVKLQVEFNPKKVAAYRLIGYESRLLNDEDFENDKVDAAEIGAGQRVTALYELIPAGVKSEFIPKVPALKYSEPQSKRQPADNEWLTVSLRYKPLDSEQSKLMQSVLLEQSPKNSKSDTQFALSVAMFAEKLRESPYTKGITFNQIIKLAEQHIGDDREGYRHEFLQLLRLAESIRLSEEKTK